MLGKPDYSPFKEHVQNDDGDDDNNDECDNAAAVVYIFVFGGEMDKAQK